MWNAVLVDRDYGSVSLERQKKLQEYYRNHNINMQLEHYKTPAEIIEGCREADVILATGNPPINREVLEALSNLKAVQRFGIGVNSVDMKAASETGTLALYMPGFCVEEIALHSMALILDILRNISYYDRGVRIGDWRKTQGPLPRNPKELTLGLFGFGASARPLCKIYSGGFVSKVLAYDPYVDSSVEKDYCVEMVSFDELIKRADIVSIHVPATPETKGAFNRDVFKKMKNDAIIINCSRGDIIAEDDLIQALEDGEIGFAGLDVFEIEPLPMESPLIKNDRVVLTPHTASYGDNAQRVQMQLAMDLVVGVLNEKTVPEKYIANKGVVSKIPGLKVVK